MTNFALSFRAVSNPTSSPATLGSTPLLHLLVSIMERQTTGTLSLETPDHLMGAIVFENGAPRKASVAAPNCRLSDLFVEFGWLDRHSAEESYAVAVSQQEPHGKVLLDFRLVDEAGLSRILVHQLIRKLGWVSTRPADTVLGLHEDADWLENVPATPTHGSPLAILWGIAKSHVDDRNKRTVLERVARRPLQLHAHSDPELFGFASAEMALVERLRHVRMDVDSLLYQIELPRQTAEALLYLLLLTRHIDVGDGRMPLGIKATAGTYGRGVSGEFSAFDPALLPRDSDETDAAIRLRRDLEGHAARLDVDDYYALFGVSPGAAIGDIRQAFTTLAKRYHPDRLPAELNDLRPVAAQVVTRLMSAYRELADADQRSRYDRSHPRPEVGPDQARLTQRRLANDAFRRAEQLLKRDRLLLAEAEARRAVELDVDNANHIALHAWILSLLPEYTSELGPILASLTKALDLEPMNVAIRFYRSVILKRLERMDEAVGEWRLITELNPKHVDAQRELRLWEMRRASSRPPKSASGTHRQVSMKAPPLGLFGRLFRGPR